MEIVILMAVLLSFTGGCAGAGKDDSGIREIRLEDQEDRNGAGKTPEEDGREEETAYVHVCGQVASPGVYELPSDARIVQAVEKAGGFLDTACREGLNLARPVQDGEQIYVPSLEEMSGSEARTSGPGTAAAQETARVNLNTAGEEELMTLTGIGQTRARAILQYREEQGLFQSAEDIMNVEGIKEGIYDKLKDQITV